MSTPQTRVDTRWFQNVLADKRLSQRKLAARLSLDPAAVSLMIRGKRKMSAGEAAEIAKFLGLSVEEVLWRSGNIETTPAKVPSKGKAPTPSHIAVATDVAVPSTELLEIPVPMSDGSLATLSLPRALTKADAERIAGLVAALAR